MASLISKGAPVVKVNSGNILNFTVVRHTLGHRDQPFELIWAFARDGRRYCGWRFFRTDRQARAFAQELVDGGVNRDGSEKANTGTTAATVAAA